MERKGSSRYPRTSVRTPLELETAFNHSADLEGCSSFYLVGIGGAGMSGIAQILKSRGFQVAGCDLVEGREVETLVERGIPVDIGLGTLPADGSWVIVVSDAIDLKTNPVVLSGRDQRFPLFRRSQVLGFLARDRRCICVIGTHGKTTTTGLLGAALMRLGLDPLIVVGAEVADFGGSVVQGKGSYAALEACEAYDSLRDLNPAHIILTNLEPDHLDFHGTPEALYAAIDRFVARLPEGGLLIYCREDSGACQTAERSKLGLRAIPYGIEHAPQAKLKLPGRHNRLNCAGVRVLMQELQVDLTEVDSALSNFTGAARRLQVVFDEEFTIVDDYAHTPEEIDAGIAAMRESYPGRRLVAVFQPHLYTRTRDRLEDFAKSLGAADLLVITDIYPAREAPIPGISSARISEACPAESFYVPQRHLLARSVKSLIRPGDVVLVMGAGNISEVPPALIEEVRRGEKKRIAVLVGGDSAEREVSLHSGSAIAASLIRQGFEVTQLDVSELLLSGQGLSMLTGAARPDLAFLAVHGNRAEDGAIQGLLELLHIPYTGSDIQTSSVAMDKALCKQLLGSHGLPFPQGVLIRKGEPLNLDSIPFDRAVVKPNAQGSTVGLSFVEKREDLEAAILKAQHYGDDVLIEEWVVGTEISVPVLSDEVLPIVEIVPATGVYDFASKYTPDATDEICPARVSDAIYQQAQDYALQAHRLLGCRGATRTDMIVSGDRIVLLEVNTLPGMTPTSLLPKSAGTAGISFDDLCLRILNDALEKV